MKILIKAMLFLIIFFIISGAALGIAILGFGISSKPVKSDSIIILGCQVYGTVPSPFLKARLDEGLRLYNEGYGSFLILSGGRGSGEEISEAEAMKNYLQSMGVDPEKMILEDRSESTMENIEFSKEKMEEHGLKTAVIVSNKYHLKRASLIAKKVGIKASFSGVFVSQHKNHEIKGFFREILALLKFYVVG